MGEEGTDTPRSVAPKSAQTPDWARLRYAHRAVPAKPRLAGLVNCGLIQQAHQMKTIV